jgi:hypothetical protein
VVIEGVSEVLFDSNFLSRTRIQDLDLRERDIYIYIAQVWILGNAFSFSQWPTRVGARLGSIYSLHTIIAIRGGG